MQTVGLDIQAVQAISAVPTIMRVIAQLTGLRWICVARVTSDAWTMCAVHDELDMGIAPGDEIAIEDTFCDRVRKFGDSVVIDHASIDPEFRTHPTPIKFGFESYFSIPVRRADGTFFGTLCGFDPKPAELRDRKTLDTLELFAELLSAQVDAELRFADTTEALHQASQAAELREQFIAILGHDLRTPLSSVLTGSELIRALTKDEKLVSVAMRIQRSAKRMVSLIDDVMDFTRGKLGGGLPVDLVETDDLAEALLHVVAEIQGGYPDRSIVADIAFNGSVYCDQKRVAQLLSNLLINAIVHGQADIPIVVTGSGGIGRLHLSVSNGGVPITPDTINRLFLPFWRGERTTKSGGLGLGLYIAAQIAKSHQATLDVHSDDQATTFVFLIDRRVATRIAGSGSVAVPL